MDETSSSPDKSESAPASKIVSSNNPDEWHYAYSTVKDFFLQDQSTVQSDSFDATKENFGLIEQEYDTDKHLPENGKDLTQWQRFAHVIEDMNQKAPKDVSYRLLYLGRHGQGYHNVAPKFYGQEAWDHYYSTLDSDPHVENFTYFDSHLTLLGKHQAYLAHQFWQDLVTKDKVPLPQKYYCSPHARSIQTAKITFSNLPLPSTHAFDPLIKESAREAYGLHTCDKRATRSHLSREFPTFRIEDPFTEEDELFTPDAREPPLHHAARLATLLDDIVTHDPSTYISITSHNGTNTAILHAVGHRPFTLQTGGVIPVLVKVEKAAGPRPDNGSADEPWELKKKYDGGGDPLKLGKDGYKDIAEYLAEIEAKVPPGPDGGYSHLDV